MRRGRFHRSERLPRDRGPIERYGVAVVATAAAAGVGGALEWQIGGSSFAPLLAAVGFSVWFGGLGPGLVAVALGALAEPLILQKPVNSFEIEGADDALRLSLYVVVGVLLVCFGEWAARERRRADAAERTSVSSEAASRAARLTSERLVDENERLHEIAVALAAAATRADVVETIAVRLFDTLGVTAGGTYLVDESEEALLLIGLYGEAPKGAAEAHSISLDVRLPVTDAVRTKKPVWLAQAADWEPYPGHERWRHSGIGSGAAVPVLAGGTVLACFVMGYPNERMLTDAERRFVETVASLAAQPLARARLHEAEREARRAADELSLRSLRLQVITESLSAALTPPEVGEVIVRQGAAALGADRALVYLRSSGEHMELLSDSGYPDGSLDRLERLDLSAAGPIPEVVRSGEPLALESAGEIAAAYPSTSKAYRGSGEQALLVAPLVAGEDVIGAIQMAFLSSRSIDPDQRGFLNIVARQCGAALERARRYETEREIAETLQHSVLPERLPTVPGICVAARYLPGTSGLDVGGDWYDVIELGGSKVGVVVGDVMGKGVRAAAAMAQLRNGLHAYALEGFRPGAVLDRVNRLAASAGTPFATAIYLVVDHATGVARYASAGHPPAVLVRSNGPRELLDVVSGLPLGVAPEEHYRTGVAELEAGDLLVLYTDGLVESRERPIADGIEELRASVPAEIELNEMLTVVIDRLLGPGNRSDDVALVAVRLDDMLAALDLKLPRDVPSLSNLRIELVPWLVSAGATETQARELAIASWEAFANALEHAQEPEEPYVRVHAERTNGAIVISVSDFGAWREPAPAPGRGLGMALMQSLVTELRVDRGEEGTIVRLRRRLEDAPR